MMNRKPSKSALVVEGGGMRGLFTAGVLHAFGKAGFDPFTLYIGVSAGACNLASHLAGQYDRNYDVNINLSTTPDFINARKFLRGGHFMDIDWLWDASMREYPIDTRDLFARLRQQGREFIVVVTSLETGMPMYLIPDEDTVAQYIKVSSSVPFFYRTVHTIEGQRATDGGVADSIPVIEAFNRGATDITVLRTRPSGYVKKPGKAAFLYPLLFRKHGMLGRALKDRPVSYMKAVQFINNPPPGVRVREIAPPEGLRIGRATTNKALLQEAYRAGIEYGRTFISAYTPAD